MASTKLRLLNPIGLAAISTSEVFIPATGWESAGGISGARGWGELRGRTGEFKATPAIQTANDIRSPDGGTAVGSAMSADGVTDPNGVTSLSISTKKYIRGGWLVALASGGTLAFGAVNGVIEYHY